MHQGAALRGGHMMRGIVCALAGSVCWGFSGTCAQLLMGDYGASAYWITCVRMLISAVFFLGVVFVKDWRSLGLYSAIGAPWSASLRSPFSESRYAR